MKSRRPPADPTLTAEQAPAAAPGGAGAPLLFLVLQADRPFASSLRLPLQGLSRVRLGRTAAREVVPEEGAGLRLGLPDRGVSSAHAELRRTPEGWTLADLGSKNGTFVDGARVREAPLAAGAWIELGGTFLRLRCALPGPDGNAPLDSATLAPPAPGLATLLPGLAADLERLRLVAASELTVLLGGESGAGKEVAARAVHALSRRPGAFVAVNCGGLAPTLLESELFGSRKGAFSGALEDRPGLLRSADRGTLFLDEVGDLPLPAQAALLRALQEREVVPVGGARPIPVDLRLLAATHRDLAALVTEGRFRADLLARLDGFRLRLPPLRERAEDLGLLTAALLRRHFPGRDDLAFTTAAARALLAWGWPLNVRELEKVLSTAVVLADGRPVDLAHLPAEVRAGPRAPPPAGRSGRALAALSPQDEALRARLLALFAEHAGNVTAVAAALGKARFQVQRWARRLGIDPQEFRRP